jgi:hypothetical protein
MPRRRDPRIDAYIRKAKPFAKPLLSRIRVIVHRAVPTIEESIKWGMPAFLVHGQIVCGMAGFTHHGAFWFWNGSALVKRGILRKEWTGGGMGSFGKLTGVKDLPAAGPLVQAVRRAAALRMAGVKKAPRRTPTR